MSHEFRYIVTTDFMPPTVPSFPLLPVISSQMSSSNYDLASVIGPHRLQTLEQASIAFPVPAIRSAAKAALMTLNLVMSIVGRQRANLIAIGREACVITVNVVRRVDPDGNGNVAHSKYSLNLEQDSTALVKEMEAIQRDIQNHRNTGGFKRIAFSRATDARVVETCRARLNKALRLFELQSDIELRQQMSLLDQNLQALLDKHDRLQAPPSLNPPHMPFPAPHSPDPPRMPSPAPQPYPHSPDSPAPAWPQPSIPSYDLSPSFPQPESISPSSWTPNNESTQVLSRSERKAARHARREARAVQQTQHTANATGYSSSPNAPAASYNTFTNIQNHLSPDNNVSYHYVNGSVTNNSRNDSFNVSGSGNKIDISFSRNRP